MQQHMMTARRLLLGLDSCGPTRPLPRTLRRSFSISCCTQKVPALRNSHRSKSEGESTKQCISVLSTAEAISRMQKVAADSTHHEPYRAMYSSILGGIVTDPAMMLIPLDDHMVHRGHGVFDTALLFNGYLYELDVHLDRLLRSVSAARITPPFSRETLRDILVETVAASGCENGSLRYWLSAGPGDFNLSSKQCKQATFYAIVLKYEHFKALEPVSVVTSSIPLKPPMFATMKNVNYLPNVLSLLEAEEKGAYTSIWVDEEGYVAEGPNMNVAFVNKGGELIMPSFDKILSGCTARRTLDLAHELMLSQAQLKGVKTTSIKMEEGKNASEMMLIGSGNPIVPVVKWDKQQIGDGKPGPITLLLQALLRQDMCNSSLAHRELITYKKTGL